MFIVKETDLSTKVLTIRAILEKYLLIGQGSNLLCYDLISGLLKWTIKLFTSSSIHGIKECIILGGKQLILVWGQKSFTILSISTNIFQLEYASQEYEIDDWIVDAAFSDKELSLFIYTAHNVLYTLSLVVLLSKKIFVEFKNPDFISLNGKSPAFFPDGCLLLKRKCSENSLLYCGCIVGNSFNTVTVLSGTVFGTVHIWAANQNESSNAAISPLLSFTAAKGAIFSIIYDEINNLIATTADDRSVRLWKVIFSASNEDYKWQNCQLQSLFVSYGHTSRVWRSLILPDETVISAGEDSIVCHWKSNGVLISSWKAHKSSSIWSLALCNTFLFTGGNDGGVKKWNLDHDSNIKHFQISLPHSESNSRNISGVLEAHEMTSKSQPNPSLRSINIIDSFNIVVVTNDGTVWLHHLEKQIWKKLLKHPLLRGYVVTVVDENSSILCLGTLSGTLLVLKIGLWKCIFEEKISSAKIHSLVFGNQNHLITCSSEGHIQLFRCVIDDAEDLKLEPKGTFILPPCRQRWINAATVLLRPTIDLKPNLYLIVGDSSGNMYAYSEKGGYHPFSEIKGLHNRNGITSLVTNGSVILTTGRDGFVRYSVLKNEILSCIHSRKIGFGTWISRLAFLQHQLVATLFSGSKLCVWNVDDEELICEVDCGGGHRSWDLLVGRQRFSLSGICTLSVVEDPTELFGVFLKDGVPVAWKYSLSGKMTRAIKCPTSGREIMDLEIFSTQNQIFYLFGGEDTLLHIHSISENKMNRIKSIKSHLSAIRSVVKIKHLKKALIHSHSTEEVQFLLSCGGRAEMKVWRLSSQQKLVKLIGYNSSASLHFETESKESNILLNEFGINDSFTTNCNDSCLLVTPLCSHMLKPDSNRRKIQNFDPETRYTDCLAFWMDDNEALFILAASDGFIRFFHFYLEDLSFDLLQEVDCNFSLLRLCLVKVAHNDFVFVSNTRGSLFIWDIQVIIQKVLSDNSQSISRSNMFAPVEYIIQDCGLNSLAACNDFVESETTFNHLVTGGDDGTVHLLRLGGGGKFCDRVNKLSLRISICYRSTLHSSQISGLAWINQKRFCSASVDQRIIIWEVTHNRIDAMKVIFSSIPDIHGIKIFRQEDTNLSDCCKTSKTSKLFVYGNGIQIFEISNKC